MWNKTKSETEAPVFTIPLSQRYQVASTESKSQDLLCSPGDEALVVLTIPLSQALEMKQLRQKREAELWKFVSAYWTKKAKKSQK